MDPTRAKPGSHPIGSLISRIVSTQRVVDGTVDASERRPTHSPTAATGMGRSTQTGTLPGGPGSATQTSSLPAILPEQAALTAQCDPARLLPQCVQSCLAAVWDGYVAAYELVAPLPDAERRAAIELAEQMLRPAGEEILITELGRLRAMTVSRDVGQDLAMLFAIYADELRDYPADAIRDVLRAWPRAERFWPSAAELRERLDRLVKPRRALLAGLRGNLRAA
jgi:hypothetical protein